MHHCLHRPVRVASCLAGMYMGLEVFDVRDRRRAEALARGHDQPGNCVWDSKEKEKTT
jgi:hypothetical protein